MDQRDQYELEKPMLDLRTVSQMAVALAGDSLINWVTKTWEGKDEGRNLLCRNEAESS